METTQTLEIPIPQACSLLEELGHTVKRDEFISLSLMIGMAQEAGETSVKLMGSLIESFNFYNDVGMI